MVELSSERVEQILHKETLKTEESATILRAIYTRYLRLYEKYFANIDALNDHEIAELREYHEETKSLVKYYYMDIPLDVCEGLNEFENNYGAKLLGPDWHKYLFDNYKDFKDRYESDGISEECLKAKFSEQNLTAFYYTMDSVFRDGFGTGSKTAERMISKITGLLFGDSKD